MKPCVKRAPRRTGGMKMGRRLVKVYKVITHLLISDTAFPWIPSGILRLHVAVRRWSWELTSCVPSGGKLSAEPSRQAGLSPSTQVCHSPSWAALLQNPTYMTCYSWLASSLPCIPEPCWHSQGGQGFFLLQWCWFFHKECEETPPSFQTHIV